ncbi:MAG: NUDIX hydrolase [Cyanobacteria bacterium]|nr:NUDIX hydrolase [Cyanobacteriota bacterium]
MGNYKGFKVRVGVVLLFEGKLVMVRQNQKNFWVFPGGTLEQGEGLVDCAIRELKEELAWDVSIEKLLYVGDFINPKKPTIDFFFLGQYLGGRLKMAEDENLDEVGFFTPKELETIEIKPLSLAQRLQQDIAENFKNASGVYLGKYSKNGEIPPLFHPNSLLPKA